MLEKSDSGRAQVKYGGSLLRHWFWCVLMLVFLIGLTAVVLYVDRKAGAIVGIFSVVLYGILFAMDIFYKPRVLQELIEFSQGYAQVQKEMMDEFAVPYGLAEPNGRMLWMNHAMVELTGKEPYYHKNIWDLFPRLQDLLQETEETAEKEILYQDRTYRVVLRRVEMNELLDNSAITQRTAENSSIISLHFFDTTELMRYRRENFEQKQVVGNIYIDNYEEVMESVEDIRRSMLGALLERRIHKYVSSMGGLCRRMERDKYFMVITRKGLEAMKEDKFSLLEDIKTVSMGNSMQATVSIGLGLENGSYIQDSDAARSSIEMALARGGDQVVMKQADKMQFFGGKTQHAERNTRVRARVKAQALKEVIGSCDHVLVMGHRITDIDSLGAAVGIARISAHLGKKAHIVLGEINSSIRQWVIELKESGEYDPDYFINHAQAIEMTGQHSAVIVVDTNRPSMVECSEILSQTRIIVVLDHHRQTTEQIEHASLSYIEPSASSACEMVSEILQYTDDEIPLKPREADCLYAGIVVDTNNFVAKTGSRTFEAAAFLRKYGADVTRVRKSFRNDMDTYKARAEAVRGAEAYMGVYAISVCPSQGLENPTVVGAQAANELLNIIGVRASFVLTDFDGKIYISARAIDEVNVQLIMERLGGGGHMNIAGAQLPGVSVDEARERLKEVLKKMTEEGEL